MPGSVRYFSWQEPTERGGASEGGCEGERGDGASLSIKSEAERDKRLRREKRRKTEEGKGEQQGDRRARGREVRER